MSLINDLSRIIWPEEKPIPGTIKYAKKKEEIRDNWQSGMDKYKGRIENIEAVIAFLDPVDPRVEFIDRIQEDIRILKTPPDLRADDDFFRCPDFDEELKRIGHFLVVESNLLERSNKLSLEERYRLNLLVDRIKGEYSEKVRVISHDRTMEPMDFIMALMFIGILLVLMLVMDSDQYKSAPMQGKLFIWSVVSLMMGSGVMAMRAFMLTKLKGK